MQAGFSLQPRIADANLADYQCGTILFELNFVQYFPSPILRNIQNRIIFVITIRQVGVG